MRRKLSMTGRIAGFSFRHKWYVLAAWLLVLVGAGIASAGLGKVLTTEQKDLSNSDSAQATQLIHDRFGERPLTEVLVTRSDTQTVDNPAFVQTVSAMALRLRGTAGIASVGTYLDSGQASNVSADRHAALTSIALTGDAKAVDEHIQGIIDAVKGAPRPAGYTLSLTGNGSANHELNAISNKDIGSAEQAGLPIALVVLLLAFGTVVAAVVPLLLGIAAIVPAVGSVALIGHVIQLNLLVTSIITMIGLAVGIDYSLFIIGRYREELGRGRTPAAAMAIAADSSGRAVFFSGITVLIALSAMLFIRVTVFVSIGIGAMTVTLFAIAASLTLLPALLGIFGRKINALRVPFLGRAHFGSRFWGAVTHAVQRHPLLYVVASAGLLLAAAFPLTGINLGSNGIESLPHNTDTYRAYTALQRDFSTGLVDPMQLVINGDIGSAVVQAAIGRLRTAVGQNSQLSWVGVTNDATGRTAIVEIASAINDTSPASLQLVRSLHDTMIPQAFAGSGASAHLGGALPAYVDVKGGMEAQMPFVFAFVLGLSFVLLLLVFRSIVIPAKAIVMNLLSVGAAYGLVVLVFQHGFLAAQLGFHQTRQTEFWLPLFLFSILFGLSMDYHVFLLSRIKEEFGRTGNNRLAVANGVQGTAGMITSAAIIMVAVFAAFSRSSMVSLQQMGFGLAIAVFLDATLIRSILVPASMQLLGHLNWWLPSWLEFLPRINVEGGAALEADEQLQLAAAD